MAQTTNGRTKLAAASVIITLLVLAGGVVNNFTRAHAAADSVGDKVEVVKTEGCLPARQAQTSVKVIETRLDGMEKIQTTRHTEIMAALKPPPAESP